MLQTFRTFINSLAGKLFFGLLVATFGLLGVGYGIRDLVLSATTSNDAATVNGAKISLQALNQEYHRQLVMAQRQMGASFNPTTQQKQAIAKETLDQAIMNMLIAQATDRDGFLVGDTLVRKVIESEPAFAGLDKRFDRARFQMALQAQGMSEATFLPQVRQSMARQLLMNPVIQSAIPPKMLVDDVYRYRNEQRVVEAVTLPVDAVKDVPKPSDADIEAYYKKHEVSFTAPAYRTFTVLPVTPELFAAGIKPTDDELHDAYNAHKAEYVDPEKRKVTQVVLNDKAAAEAVIKATQGGKSLADAAKEASAGKAAANALDFLPKDQFPEALRDPVFAATNGSLVGPIQTLLGWHVVRIDEVRAGHDVPFDAVKAKLADQVKRDQAINLLAERIDKLGDKLTGGSAMEQVGAEINATPVKIGPVDAKGEPGPGANKDQKPDPAWIATAFGLQRGETSAFQDDKTGGYFAVRLDSDIPPTLRPLAEVRDAVIAAWTREQQAAATVKRAEALAAKAKAGTPMSDIAAQAVVSLETLTPMTRESAKSADAKGPSPLLVDSVFQLAKLGDVTTVDTDDAQIIVKLKEIRQADPKLAGSRMEGLVKEMTTAFQGDAYDQFRNGLRESATLKINPQAAELVAGQ